MKSIFTDTRDGIRNRKCRKSCTTLESVISDSDESIRQDQVFYLIFIGSPWHCRRVIVIHIPIPGDSQRSHIVKCPCKRVTAGSFRNNGSGGGGVTYCHGHAAPSSRGSTIRTMRTDSKLDFMSRFHKTAVQGNTRLRGSIVGIIQRSIRGEIFDTIFIRGSAIHGIP